MVRIILPALSAVALLLVSAGTGLHAHEGHDHGSAAPAAPASVAPRGEAHSERFEVVAVVRGRTLAIYLDDYRTNAPVEQAEIEIETPSGPVAAKAIGNGVYSLEAPFLENGGHLDLIVTVTAGGEPDILPISIDVPQSDATASRGAIPPGNGVLMILASLSRSPLAAGLTGFILGALLIGFVRRSRRAGAVMLVFALAGLADAKAHEGHDHAPEPAAASNGDQRAQRQPDGTVFVPKPIQRIFGVRTIETQHGTFARTVELPGRIIPDPNASGYVQTAVGGVLSPPPGGFPRLGTQVKEGDILAYVTPPIAAIDVSDMRQKQGELDQQIAIVQRRLARQEKLVTSGAVARTQVEETQLELEGLKDRRAALDRIRSDPIPLIAPVSGIIAEGTPITGQIAQSNAVVFHIVTPEKLWVEALSFDTVAGTGRASAKTAGGKPLVLTFRGSGLADRSQSIPVHFSVDDGGKGLRAGQFVTVFTETGEERSGIAVPRTAVIRAANGQDVVFEHTTAERFEPRPVRTEPLDAERILIAAGIDPGKRVVVQGAELLDHVR
ncbi:efflux RND transporter periplasmic adaptor subunit [Pseudorhodoplanes sp.]|uniref:efflux RND transporter periplasmic adaptor subunit n=1 Tax=Pseudorhodoplanes sp. TaxID=1934341 RepID=UPI003D0C4C92